MTPDYALTIKANPALTTQDAVQRYIERLQNDHPALGRFGGALVDIVNTANDDEVEVYIVPGTLLLWMPAIGRAALNASQVGDWQWTDAESPDDALRRYHDDDMRP